MYRSSGALGPAGCTDAADVMITEFRNDCIGAVANVFDAMLGVLGWDAKVGMSCRAPVGQSSGANGGDSMGEVSESSSVGEKALVVSSSPSADEVAVSERRIFSGEATKGR